MIPFGEVQEGRRFRDKDGCELIKTPPFDCNDIWCNCVTTDHPYDHIDYAHIAIEDSEMVTLIDTCLQCKHFNPALNIEGQKCNKLSLFFGHGGEHGNGFLQNPATFHCSEWRPKE